MGVGVGVGVGVMVGDGVGVTVGDGVGAVVEVGVGADVGAAVGVAATDEHPAMSAASRTGTMSRIERFMAYLVIAWKPRSHELTALCSSRGATRVTQPTRRLDPAVPATFYPASKTSTAAVPACSSLNAAFRSPVTIS
jgi:hypothetical protein